MEKKDLPLSEDTLLVHDQRYSQGAVAPPVYQTSIFTFDSYQSMVERFGGDSSQPVYSRVDNPTVSVFLEKMCQLEGGEAGAAFASGMGAISNAILSQVRSGDRIVCVKHVYPDTYRLLRGVCARFGIKTEFVDGTDLEAIKAALPGAKLLYLESPSTWVMQEQDLEAVAGLARSEGVTTIVDNSWASPIFQKPLSVGIDLVVHSASKYISGHSDTVAGVLVGRRNIIDQMTLELTPYLGAKLSAQEAALLIRGLRTLPLRMRRHQESGLEIAHRLSRHARVEKVHHPALSIRGYSLLKGYGGLFSFEVDESLNIAAFCDALSIFRLGVSWGGHESLVMPADVSIRQAGEHNAAVDFGVSPRTIRLFVGLENPDDLWSDLSRAFANA
jgi:cystathionine beta-lyase/cystathionine gamma-synthase